LDAVGIQIRNLYPPRLLADAIRIWNVPHFAFEWLAYLGFAHLPRMPLLMITNILTNLNGTSTRQTT
jgi:hypothetical protein